MGEKMGTGTPTVGRQVVYYPPSQPDGAPAIVTGVNHNGTLSLFVMTRAEAFHRGDAVEYQYEEGDDEGDKIGFWEWPERI